MGIFSFVKKQFIDVIDWTESGDGVLAYRYPMEDREIQNGAQLTVRDSQLALFVNEGEVADVLEPGLHTLNTRTLPFLTNLRNWDKAFASPFKSDLYFFSTREQLNQTWGTAQPITVRDHEFGALRVRAHGSFSYVLKNPKVFYKKISGSREIYTAEDLAGQLRSMILTSLGSFFGGAEVGFIDMAANQVKFSDTLKEALSIPFSQYGIELKTFQVQSISLPEELQAALDKRSSMNLIGDLGKYTQYQVADSIGTAASHDSAAGAAASMSTGLAMGQAMNAALHTNAMNPSSANIDRAGQGGADDPVAMLGKLHELVTKGILTQSEFDSKKSELLKKIM